MQQRRGPFSRVTIHWIAANGSPSVCRYSSCAIGDTFRHPGPRLQRPQVLGPLLLLKLQIIPFRQRESTSFTSMLHRLPLHLRLQVLKGDFRQIPWKKIGRYIRITCPESISFSKTQSGQLFHTRHVECYSQLSSPCPLMTHVLM